ncbi:MAG: UDP-2,3-diacylglucosamine diphosphatase [Candidatus Eisenbacteria bacterium]|uniref:UDP-2,3-diacylglucosamine diphosphatase n=1 Tax=Eiseniibacteriota bacterium TaxID=2212470 RepID=A0A538SFV8_UNCEI|nr:MAG: UDP-2,3-diacylglucosamine diphosphatase [Candidatus Eisenbacteria bacterium]
MSEGAAYFFSDAHLGAESEDREAARTSRLHQFLGALPGRASSLHIVGDLFDFWFEYRTAIPRRHFETLSALQRVRQAGIGITYLTGNHDFWLGPFLSRELGIETHEGPLELELQGRRIWVHHGDGLVRGDLGYRVLKKVMRNPFSIACYQLLHPDLGIPLAHWASRLSRGSREDRPLEPERLRHDVADPRFSDGFDAVLIGHFHHAYEHRENGHEFFILGDWIRRFTYLVLENGQFRMKTWPPA